MTDISTGPAPRSLQDLIRGQVRVNKSLGFVLAAAFLVNAGLIAVIVAAFVGPLGLVITALLLLGAVGWAAIKFRAAACSEADMRVPSSGETVRLTPIVTQVCQTLGIPIPAIRIMPDHDVLNACSWSVGSQASIAYTTGLLAALSDEELEAVTAHEAGHIVSRDSRMYQFAYAGLAWATLMTHIFAVFTTFLVALGSHFAFSPTDDRDPADAAANFLLRLIFGVMFFAAAATVFILSHIWFFVARLLHIGVIRQREWMADAIAVRATGNPQALADALLRLEHGETTLRHGGAALQAACIAGEKRPEKNPLRRTVRHGAAVFDLLDDHPSTDRRIARLERFGDDPSRGPSGSGALVAAGICTLVIAVPVVIGMVEVFVPHAAATVVPDEVAVQQSVGSTESTNGTTEGTTDASTSPSDSSAGPTTAPPGPYTTSDALITVAAGPWSSDLASAVAVPFDTYFSGINNKDFPAAYGAFSPHFQAHVGSVESWSPGLATTTDGNISIDAIDPAAAAPGTDPVHVQVSFTSAQGPDFGPNPGETCTHWTLTYMLVPSNGTYLIDSRMPSTGPGHTAC